MVQRVCCSRWTVSTYDGGGEEREKRKKTTKKDGKPQRRRKTEVREPVGAEGGRGGARGRRIEKTRSQKATTKDGEGVGGGGGETTENRVFVA